MVVPGPVCGNPVGRDIFSHGMAMELMLEWLWHIGIVVFVVLVGWVWQTRRGNQSFHEPHGGKESSIPSESPRIISPTSTPTTSHLQALGPSQRKALKAIFSSVSLIASIFRDRSYADMADPIRPKPFSISATWPSKI